jgi:hypothetical protein
MQKEYDAIITNMAKLLEVQQKRACAKLCEDLDAWNMDDPAYIRHKPSEQGDKHDNKTMDGSKQSMVGAKQTLVAIRLA